MVAGLVLPDAGQLKHSTAQHNSRRPRRAAVKSDFGRASAADMCRIIAFVFLTQLAPLKRENGHEPSRATAGRRRGKTARYGTVAWGRRARAFSWLELVMVRGSPCCNCPQPRAVARWRKAILAHGGLCAQSGVEIDLVSSLRCRHDSWTAVRSIRREPAADPRGRRQPFCSLTSFILSVSVWPSVRRWAERRCSSFHARTPNRSRRLMRGGRDT